jgi:hypothetical protein
MYSIFLTLHNYFRWIVIALAAWALWQAYRGLIAKRSFSEADRRSTLFYSISIDIQLLLGLILTFSSPIIRSALADMSAAMAADQVRFFITEHIPMMVIVFVLAHIGSNSIKKASSDALRHRRAAIWHTVTTLAILLMIPWWRPLLRGIL